MECRFEKRFSGTTSSRPMQTRVKQYVETGVGDEPELVKYMSKLPVYLERAETPQDKLLSVGVLDWGRLEKWQHSHNNRIPGKGRFPSVYQADASLGEVRDESSAGPSKVHTRTSDRPRKHRSSRQRHPTSNSVEEMVKEYREIKGTEDKKPKDHRCFSIPDEQLCPNTQVQESDGYQKKALKEEICRRTDFLPNSLNPEAGEKIEVKSKANGNRRRKDEKKLRERNPNDHDGELGQNKQVESKLYHSTKKLPREEAKSCKKSSTKKADYCSEHSCPLPCKTEGCLAKSGISSTYADPKLLGEEAKKVSQEESKTCKRSSTKKVDYCAEYSFPLPSKTDGRMTKSNIGSTYAEPNKASVEISECVPLSTKASNTSSRGKTTEDRASSLLAVKHHTDKPAQRQDSQSHKAASEKRRSISPFQRLSFTMGKTSNSNSQGVAVPVAQVDSAGNSTKIGSRNVALSSGGDGSDCNKPSEKETTTTSHFRRLLKPLLKPRASHSGNSVDGPKGEGVQRKKLGITGCKTVNVNDSAHERKLGSSMVRAVLRVTIKNNQPLFTFAVNKETDIIAATQKKMGSSDEGECTSVYTFFDIKDHKRNSAWLNQRGRGQTHGIISNVVAQMRVSSSLPSGSIREFVLFSVELDAENPEKSDLQLTNELAAIIVKMPRWLQRRVSLNTVQDHNGLNKRDEDVVKDKFLDQDISATVILQSGVHSMPQKGGPSSLIQRWRTGGSCDCGGWDMGCNLKILTNQHNLSSKNLTTSNSPPSSNRLELFFLGEQPEEHPYLSFKPIKEGIYSVAYNPSLSQLQAFSICMALAESRKISEISLEHKSSFDEQHKARPETVLVPDQDPKPNVNTVEYQPPLSPVGRV